MPKIKYTKWAGQIRWREGDAANNFQNYTGYLFNYQVAGGSILFLLHKRGKEWVVTHFASGQSLAYSAKKSLAQEKLATRIANVGEENVLHTIKNAQIFNVL